MCSIHRRVGDRDGLGEEARHGNCTAVRAHRVQLRCNGAAPLLRLHSWGRAESGERRETRAEGRDESREQRAESREDRGDRRQATGDRRQTGERREKTEATDERRKTKDDRRQTTDDRGRQGRQRTTETTEAAGRLILLWVLMSAVAPAGLGMDCADSFFSSSFIAHHALNSQPIASAVPIQS